MSKQIKLAFMAIFLIGAMVLLVGYNASKPKILILQSYDTDYSWTREVDVGIRRVLNKYQGDITLRWYYMDLKRNPWPNAKVNAGIAARRVIEEWKPDVILAVDDNAQEYVTMHYINHPTINIVFSGVNGDMKDYGFDKPEVTNVTGILERNPLSMMKEFVLDYVKQKGLPADHVARVTVLGDDSEAVNLAVRQMRKFDWAPVKVDIKQLKTYDEWKQAVTASSEAADFLIAINYRGLRRVAGENKLVPVKEVVDWTENNSPVPIMGPYGFYVDDGGMLSIGTSPYEQGEVAAKMALRIVKEKIPAGRIPPEATKQFVIYLRESRLKEAKFSLPPIFEAFARATNNYIEAPATKAAAPAKGK